MGAGIAEIFARNGYSVVGVELNDETLDRGRQHLQNSTDRAVARGKLSEAEQHELLGRITFSTGLDDLKDCDLVVEAVVEQLPVKQEVIRRVDDLVDPEAIIATNTSSLSVTELSTATGRPGRVVGIHFFNPAPVQKLVEIVRTVVTEQDVADDVAAFAATLDKVPVVIGDRAGFIANALLFGYLDRKSTV
jgi:3-hydroxybutyryl-CoA dehydrogenase